jgi:hypothetical protein
MTELWIKSDNSRWNVVWLQQIINSSVQLEKITNCIISLFHRQAFIFWYLVKGHKIEFHQIEIRVFHKVESFTKIFTYLFEAPDEKHVKACHKA